MGNEEYTKLVEHFKQTALLSSCGSVLSWDERTYLPKGGGAHRGNQLALIAGLTHDRITDPIIGELLSEAEASDLVDDPLSVEAVNVREWRRQFDRETKLPKSLVEEVARVTTIGQQVWTEARANRDFAAFAPTLEEVVRLKRDEARALDTGRTLYDALLDDYEPGETTANLTLVFEPLRDALVALFEKIQGADRRPDLSVLRRDYPVEKQEAFGKAAAAAIGFDFERGRLDVTTHPFCNGLGPGDTRITTRYSKNAFNEAFFGILHEAGHGLYDQGTLDDHWGTPIGSAVSLGIHESQSRLWENFVGRSAAFWRHFYPKLRDAFPGVLDDVAEDDFVFAVNDVRPSFIRVEADEVTYNLHILLRFEIEQAIINDDVPVSELPTVWNQKFERFFGMRPPDDAAGALQDIHWSGGGIGYFPTYTLGNLYAAMFYDCAKKELDDLPSQFSSGTFEPLKAWLTEKIYAQGKRYWSNDLAMAVTGDGLSYEPLVRHLTEKYEALYGV